MSAGSGARAVAPRSRPRRGCAASPLARARASAHLQRHDDHDDLFFARREEGLDERVAGADEGDDDNDQAAAQKVEDVEDDVPARRVARQRDEVVHERLDEQRRRLGDDEQRHQVVDALHVGRVAPRVPEPHGRQARKQHRQHAVQRGQRHLRARGRTEWRDEKGAVGGGEKRRAATRSRAARAAPRPPTGSWVRGWRTCTPG